MADETFSKTQVITLIKQLTGQANLLTTPTLFIRALGDMNSAVLLGQILYWQDKTTRKDGYFWKSRRDWNDETGLSEHESRRATKVLVKASCGLETKLLRADGAPTIHYHLDKDKFLAWLMSISDAVRQMELTQGSNGIDLEVKTRTETTHQITNSKDHSIISSSPSSKKIAASSKSALPNHEKRKVEISQEKVLEPVH